MSDVFISRREYYGTARENLRWWALVVLAAVAFAMWGIMAFPWLDEDRPAFLRLLVASYLTALVIVFGARQRLFPWGSKLPAVKWFAIVAFAFVGMMFVVGGYLVLNGVLDRSPALSRRFVVIKRTTPTSFRIVPLDNLQANASILSARRPPSEILQVDCVVSVTIKPGAFGHAWVSGYRVDAADYRTEIARWTLAGCAPNTRVQRTRPCASLRGSPLTRHPLGGL